tara:strand:- start:7799 stop:8104 length:306 start_codon:yes stop_codon:yes gene_type:complete
MISVFEGIPLSLLMRARKHTLTCDLVKVTAIFDPRFLVLSSYVGRGELYNAISLVLTMTTDLYTGYSIEVSILNDTLVLEADNLVVSHKVYSFPLWLSRFT